MSTQDASRWHRIKELFSAARSLTGADRQRFLAEQCADSTDLHAEVEALLTEDAATDAFDADPGAAVRAMIDSGPTATAQAPILPPTNIGPYAVERELGHGSFSTVYLARQESPARSVALKVLRGPFVSASAIRREAEVLGQLRHPGVATVYECRVHGRDGGVGYIAMEWIDGPRITNYAQRGGLKSRERVALFLRVCEAVEYAHQRGVIHRDLKPANVLVDEHGQPKVLDFGLAGVVGSGLVVASLSINIGQLVGTLAYMSPEQFSGTVAPLDTRADVYSLGVMLYELLSGEVPVRIADMSLPEAIRTLQSAEPTRLGMRAVELRGDLEVIVAKAMDRDIGRRYQSAGELAADLRRWLADEPILARKAAWHYYAVRLIRRHRSATVVLAILALVVVGAVASLISLERRATRNYILARETVSEMMSAIADTLTAETGTVEARTALLTRLDGAVQQLSASKPTDPRTKSARAALLLALSDVKHQQGASSEALVKRQEALALFRDVVAAGPFSVKDHRGLADTCAKVGDCLKESGDMDGAERLYREALAIDERLVRDDPLNPRLVDDLGWSIERVAEVESQHGRWAQARALAERRLATALRGAEMSDNPAAAYSLWVAHVYLAGPLRALSESNLELLHLRAGRALGEGLVDQFPRNRVYLRYLALTHAGLERNCREHGDVEAARLSAEEYSRRAEQLYALDPNDVEALDLVVGSRIPLAELLARTGDRLRSHAMLERSLTDARRLRTLRPEPAQGEPLALTLDALAKAYAAEGDTERAELHAAESLSIREKAAHRANASLRDVIAWTHSLLVVVPERLRDPARAASAIEAAIGTSDVPSAVLELASRACEAAGRKQDAQVWAKRARSVTDRAAEGR